MRNGILALIILTVVFLLLLIGHIEQALAYVLGLVIGFFWGGYGTMWVFRGKK